MKLTDLMENNMYTAYVLDDATRDALAQRFPPKYPKFIGHHITVKFPVAKDATVPEPAKSIKVVGYADSGDGLEALVCSVNGDSNRGDGNKFHITWSLDPSKYSAMDSNKLINEKGYTIIRSIPIAATPEILS